MCSGRRRSNGRRIEMEKSPAALRRCRIILCHEFAGAFLLSDRVLRDCTPRALPRASRAGRHVASLRTMTRQAVQRCTSALLPLNYPVHGAQGARYSQICSTHVRRCPVHLGRPLLRLPRRFAPRNDKSGAITVLTGACTSRQRCAGSGMPLPYNSGCGRRNCFKICNCQWRSGSAATDAIGLYVFAGSPFESAAVRRAGLSPPIQHLTILQRHYFT